MNYNKKEATRKQKKLVSRASKNKRKVGVSLFKAFLVCIVAIVAIGIGAGFGMLKGILDNAPDINDIDVQPDGFQTTVYNQDGDIVTTLSTINSNREYAYYDDIPDNMINAFVAIEDERYWTHNGIDMRGIMRAFYVGVKNGNFSEGASTITQQLLKNEVFDVGLTETTFMDSVQRKVQEQYLAVELEKRMSKKEIMECYLNSIYLGQGAHGVQTAANTYFNKELGDLSLSECAVIAAITQNPSKYDPTAFPEKNAERRQRVLDNMLEQDLISKSEYDEACADDVYSRIQLNYNTNVENQASNSYFIDTVIGKLTDQLINDLGYTETQAYNAVYAGGLSIYITQDQDIQNICDSVINDDAYYPAGTKVALSYQLSLVDEDGEPTNFSTNYYLKYYKNATGHDNYSLIYASEEDARAAADVFKQAMLDENPDLKFLAENFQTTIQPQASFTLIEQSTGYVKAIVGGRGEKVGNLTLNRATDSARQPGSCFKVLAAFVPALDTSGMTLATVYEDAPFAYDNGREVKNWWGSAYRGFATIRDAIRDSMNVIAVKTITDVGPQVSFDYLINMGFTTLVDSETDDEGRVYSDIQQSLALGGITNGITNLEITAAYASIANGGVYVEPTFYTKVLDHDGNVLIDNTPESRQVMKTTTAWLINNAMQDVVTSGTGGSARLSSGMPVSGKTGTTSSNYDFWFCGSTPYYTASIWMGYDVNTTFAGEGWHTRLWAAIMNQVVELKAQEVKGFPQCEGITSASVCTISGLLPGETCTAHTEYFAVGTVPTDTCNNHVTVEICSESKLPATEYCPDHFPVTYTVKEDGTISVSEEYGLPEGFETKTCPIHTVPAEPTTITIASSVSGSGGTITPTTTVDVGGSKTFYITPNSGYAISDVIVDGTSVGRVSSYNFINVNKDHTIVVRFSATSGGTTTPPSTDTTATSTDTTATP